MGGASNKTGAAKAYCWARPTAMPLWFVGGHDFGQRLAGQTKTAAGVASCRHGRHYCRRHKNTARDRRCSRVMNSPPPCSAGSMCPAASTCPGNSRSRRIASGSRKSCCNRPRWQPSFLTTSGSCSVFPRCRRSRPRPTMKCCICGQDWDITHAPEICCRRRDGSSPSTAENFRTRWMRCRRCRASVARQRAPSSRSPSHNGIRFSTVTSNEC